MDKSKKILILGGGGFIGGNLSRYLAEEGYEVTVFDLNIPEKKKPGIRYLAGDFFSDETLDGITDGQDVIFHALSTINPGNSNRDYLRGYAGEFVQTVKLFDLACRKKSRVIFLSSAGTVSGKACPAADQSLWQHQGVR